MLRIVTVPLLGGDVGIGVEPGYVGVAVTVAIRVGVGLGVGKLKFGSTGGSNSTE
jgi:hypothetical protein